MANRYFVNGGVDSNWGTTSNWATTSGGVGPVAVPLATDDVFFDASSPNCTVNTSNRVAKTLNFTGYTNTITMTFSITVSGSVTLAAGMTISGSGSLVVNAAATLTSNGKTWPNSFQLTAASATHTLADDWTVGSLSVSGSSTVLNGLFTVYINGGISVTATGNGFAGTSSVVLQGTGTWSGSSRVSVDMTINTAGTITVSGTVRFDTKTLTYTAGTVVTAGSTFGPQVDATFNTNGDTGTGLSTTSSTGINWNNVTLTGGGSSANTYTLTSPLTILGTLNLNAGAGQDVTVNGSAMYAHGSVAMPGATAQGTSHLYLRGTGTLSTTGAFYGGIYNNLTIDTPGTITFASSLEYRNGTFTYTAGTVVTTGSTMRVGSSCTFNTAGMSFNNVSFSTTTSTITLGSAMTLNGTLTIILTSGSTMNWAGAGSWTCHTLSMASNNCTVNLLSGNTYTVTNAASLIATVNSRITLKASVTNGTKAIFTVNPDATIDFSFVNGTDIDSSGGQTIYTRKGTLTRTTNWKLLTAPVTSSETFSTW